MQKKAIKALLLATSFFFLATGCSGISSVKNWKESLQGTSLSEEVDEPLIEGLVRREGHKKFPKVSQSSVEKRYQEDVLDVRFSGVSLVHVPSLERYANKILLRLIESWQGRPVNAKVFITSKYNINASARKGGAIFIPLATIYSLKNEDELAAILAHELSHVILRHSVNDKYKVLTRMLVSGSEKYLSHRAKSDGDEKVQNDYVRMRAIDWVTHKLLMPSWGRAQENEADLLAVDLLVKTGFNVDGMVMFLKLLEESSEGDKKFLANSQIRLKGYKFSSNKTKNSLVYRLISIAEGIFSKEHDEAGLRQKQVRRYVKRFYADRKREAFKSRNYNRVMGSNSVKKAVYNYKSAYSADELMISGKGSARSNLRKAAQLGLRSLGGNEVIKNDTHNRMLMYHIRNRQNEKRRAIKNLEYAYRSGGATFEIYSILEDDAYRKGEYQKSLNYLNEMKEVFGSRVPAALLKKISKVNKKLEESLPRAKKKRRERSRCKRGEIQLKESGCFKPYDALLRLFK